MPSSLITANTYVEGGPLPDHTPYQNTDFLYKDTFHSYILNVQSFPVFRGMYNAHMKGRQILLKNPARERRRKAREKKKFGVMPEKKAKEM